MEPTLSEGDIVFVVKTSPLTIIEGEILVFSARGSTIVHRVVRSQESTSESQYITQGDANPFTDQQSGLAPIKSSDIHGVLLMIDGHPLTIPAIGSLYVLIHSVLLHWTSGRLLLLVPCVMLGILLSVTGTKDLHKLAFPFTRSQMTKTTLISLIVTTGVLTQASLITLSPFRLHSYSMVIGVETSSYDAVDFNLGSLELADEKNATITLYASSALPLPAKGITFIDGNISSIVHTYQSVVAISPDKLAHRVDTQAYVPVEVDPGVYAGRFYVYNRPIWALLPIENIAYTFTSNYLLNIVILELLSNLVIAGGLTVVQLLCIKMFNYFADTVIWHYEDSNWFGWRIISWQDTVTACFARIHLPSRVSWNTIKRNIDRLSYEPPSTLKTLCPFLVVCAFPSFIGNFGLSLLFTSCIPAIYYVLKNKQAWVADLTMISVLASGCATVLYMSNWILTHSFEVTIWSIYSLIAPTITITLMGLLVSSPLVYVTVYGLLKWKARVPGRSLDIEGDWDVVP